MSKKDLKIVMVIFFGALVCGLADASFVGGYFLGNICCLGMVVTESSKK